MTKRKSTKRALLLSALSLLMCVSMLIGSTFAWFTDSVTSGNNIIKSGNLDVELEYKKVVDGVATEWATVKDETDIFDPNALWEPGRVEVVYLKVSNLGTLELKYQLGVNVIKETLGKTEDGKDIKLSDHLVFKTIELKEEEVGTYTRESAKTAAGIAKGLKDYNGETTALEVGGKDYVALIVYMPETVGNEANYRGTDVPTIELGINLYATQYTAENDSFGKDYDKNAWADGMKVYNAQDLQAALDNAKPGDTITLENNIDLTEAATVPATPATYSMRSAPKAITINLNGKTLSNAAGYVIENKGNIVITGNGTFTGLGGIRSTAGSVIIENGNFYFSSRWDQGTYQHALKAENSIVEINGGNFDATVNGQNNAMFNASTNAVITINGGSFKNVAGELTNFDPYLFTYEKNGQVIINGGTFYGGWRFNGETATTEIYGGTFALTTDGQSFQAGNTHTLKVYGGTFTFGKDDTKTAVLARVADDFKAVNNGNGTYTVIPAQEDGKELSLLAGYPGLYIDNANGYYIYDRQGLQSLNNWITMSNSNGKTFNIMADIDATGFTWNCKMVSPDGDNTPGLTFNGNNHTISNLTIADGGLFTLAPNGTYATEPATFKDITFDNVTVTGGYHTGVVWGQVSGDLVLDNVHVKNSNITGDYNVGGLVGSTGEFAVDASVKYVDCSVTNTTLTAKGAAGGDPTGASAFIGRALGKTKLVFEGNNVVENITYVNKNGLVGGGIYGYTAWAGSGFACTGKCDTFENWEGISAVIASTTTELIDAIKVAPVGEETTIVMADGTYAGNIDITVAALGAAGGDVVIKAANGAKPVIAGTVKIGYRQQNVGAASYKAKITFDGITFDHAETGKHCLDVQDVESFYMVNCTVIGDGEYGLSTPGSNGTGAAKIESCKFINAGLQLAGKFAQTLVIDDCEFDESVINVQGGGPLGPTIQNSKFDITLTAAHSGQSFYVIRNSNAGANIKVNHCKINVDAEQGFTGVAGSKGWGVFVNRVASYNIDAHDVKITMTDAALAQSALKVATCLSTGKINMTEVTLNGVTVQ